MARNLQMSRGITGVVKRFLKQQHPSPIVVTGTTTFGRRGVHDSVYDKNVDDQLRTNLVPDEVIQPSQSEEYWAPHPETGVFTPPAEHEQQGRAGGDRSTQYGNGGSDTVLEQQAWFRPNENVEKPVDDEPSIVATGSF